MKVIEGILLAAIGTLFMRILLIRPNEKMHHTDPISNLDKQQERRLMNFYIFVSLSAGLLAPYSVRVIALALGILQNTYHLEDFAWLSLPFIYLSVHLARKKSQWDVKMFETMWRTAMLTGYIIYLVAGLYMEAHELEGRLISGMNFSPRNMLIFVLLPFFTIFCMRLAMSAMSKTPSTEITVPVVSHTPIGVGGWLGFLCFQLLVGGPFHLLWGIWDVLYHELYRDPTTGQLLDFLSGRGMIGILITVLTIFGTLFGVYAGVGLVRLRPKAVSVAKAYFVYVILYWLILPTVSAGLAPLVTAGIWYSYLCRSKRVKATYGPSASAP